MTAPATGEVGRRKLRALRTGDKLKCVDFIKNLKHFLCINKALPSATRTRHRPQRPSASPVSARVEPPSSRRVTLGGLLLLQLVPPTLVPVVADVARRNKSRVHPQPRHAATGWGWGWLLPLTAATAPPIPRPRCPRQRQPESRGPRRTARLLPRGAGRPGAPLRNWVSPDVWGCQQRRAARAQAATSASHPVAVGAAQPRAALVAPPLRGAAGAARTARTQSAAAWGSVAWAGLGWGGDGPVGVPAVTQFTSILTSAARHCAP